MKKIVLLILVFGLLCASACAEGTIPMGDEATIAGAYSIIVEDVQWVTSANSEYMDVYISMSIANWDHAPLDFKNLAAGRVKMVYAEHEYNFPVTFAGYTYPGGNNVSDDKYLIPELTQIQCVWTGSVPNTAPNDDMTVEFFLSIGENAHVFNLKPEVVKTDRTLRVGEMVAFGSYTQGVSGAEPMMWEIRNIGTEKVLLVCAKIIEWKPYNDAFMSVRWSDSSLRKWLNASFLNGSFTAPERGAILATANVNAGNPQTGIDGGPDTDDYLFLLSYVECQQYYSAQNSRVCQMTDLASSRGISRETNGAGGFWWLRTPGGSAGNAVYVDDEGTIDLYGKCVDAEKIGLRPACYVKLAYIQQFFKD